MSEFDELSAIAAKYGDGSVHGVMVCDHTGIYVRGPCWVCQTMMLYNPFVVPSIPGSYNHTGTSQPVCRVCVDRANPHRVANGLDEIVIHESAYEPAKNWTNTLSTGSE